MDALTILALIVLAGFLATVAAAVASAVYIGRRGVRAGRAASRQLTRARTSTRAAIPGPAQAVHAERARVAREVGSALTAFEAGRAARRPVQVFAGHATVVRQVGARLDVDLAVVASEPDPTVRRELAAAQQPRIDTLVRACGQLRRGVLLAGDTYAEAALAHAAHELDEQVEWLTARAGAYRDLTH